MATEHSFPRLQQGDAIRVISPSASLASISEKSRNSATQRLNELGFKLSFGENVEELDSFMSSSIRSRIDDLHQAFLDEGVKAIFATIGGYNSNQLLRYIDWDLVRDHPKIFCGYSDITVLSNAFLEMSKLMTYSGPNYVTFAQKLYLDYTLEYFVRSLMSDKPYEVFPSVQWTDDEWYLNQDERKLIDNSGYFVIHEGEAEGQIIGGSLCSLNLLQGTEYFPSLNDTVLFLEDYSAVTPQVFDRDLQSLIHQPDFESVRGIVIGRFTKKSKMSDELLKKIITSKKELSGIPIMANFDFGHTDPFFTFPIGGQVKIYADSSNPRMIITEH